MAKFTEDIRFRKSRVIVRLSEHQDFTTSLEQFDKWLKRTKKALESQKQISPLPEEVNSQMLKAEVIYEMFYTRSTLTIEGLHHNLSCYSEFLARCDRKSHHLKQQ